MDEKTPPRPTVSVPNYEQLPQASSSRRDRAASLSIARSPSVLSSSFGNPLSGEASQSHAPNHSYSLSLSIPPPQSGPISYSNSLSYSKPLALGRTRTLPSPEQDKSLTRTSTLPTTLKEEDEARERFMNGLGRGSDVEEDEEEFLSDEENEVDDGLMGRSIGFQKPDRRELIWMLSSLGGVLVISLAAGMTTIYDWVF